MSGTSALEVGVVAAAATIAGALVSYLGILYQSKSQLRQAREQRTETLAAERRKTRRDTYLQLLDQVRVTEQEIDALWKQLGGLTPGPASVDAAVQEVDRLTSLANLVILEGPQSAGDVAKFRVLRELQKELVAAIKIDNERQGRPSSRAAVIQADFIPTRWDAKDEFIKTIKQVLGSDLDPGVPMAEVN